MEAVWHHSLHTSCPDQDAHDVQKTWWHQVAESLLNEALRAEGGSLTESNLAVQQHSELWTLRMPGSPCLMHMLFQQILGVGNQANQQEDFLLIVRDRADKLAQLMEHCLPEPLWRALQEAGNCMHSGGVGLLGEDVIAEVASRACESLSEWPGYSVFKSVHVHLHILVSELTARLLASMPGEEPSDDSHALVALWPAVAASLLLPISQQVASLQVRCPSERDQHWQDVWIPLCLPLPSSITWESIRLSGIGAALQLHASVLEVSIDDSLNAAGGLV